MSEKPDSEISLHDVPVIANGYRLQFEQAQESWVLLYPEGMVKLNPSASEILQCCDGLASVESITQTLEKKFETTGLQDDVVAFLTIARDQHWLSLKEGTSTLSESAVTPAADDKP